MDIDYKCDYWNQWLQFMTDDESIFFSMFWNFYLYMIWIFVWLALLNNSFHRTFKITCVHFWLPAWGQTDLKINHSPCLILSTKTLTGHQPPNNKVNAMLIWCEQNIKRYTLGCPATMGYIPCSPPYVLPSSSVWITTNDKHFTKCNVCIKNLFRGLKRSIQLTVDK